MAKSMKTKKTVISLGGKTAIVTSKRQKKRSKASEKAKTFSLANFMKPGYFEPQDFKMTYEIRRIQREKCDEAKLCKIFSKENNTDAKLEAAYEKYGSPFTKLNSWFYALVVRCPEFDAFISEVLGNTVKASERKKVYNKIVSSQAFGIVKALLFAKRNYRYNLPGFKSLKRCQEWCDKNGIKINAEEVYRNTKTC